MAGYHRMWVCHVLSTIVIGAYLGNTKREKVLPDYVYVVQVLPQGVKVANGNSDTKARNMFDMGKGDCRDCCQLIVLHARGRKLLLNACLIFLADTILHHLIGGLSPYL